MNKRGARLGQHFLKHAWAARALAHAANPRTNETILEVGPGKGILTRELLQLGRVVAIEKDPALVEVLRGTFPDELRSGKFTIVAADVRDVTPQSLGLAAESYVLAANIPYYITGEIIRHFLESAAPPRGMALLIQKEVAQRIVSDRESILSLSVKAYGTPKIVARVSKTHFSPPPRVDSAIIVVENISKSFFEHLSEEHFFAVVRAGFASKRKYLANNLAVHFTKEAVAHAFARLDIRERARAEDVPLAKWRGLAELL